MYLLHGSKIWGAMAVYPSVLDLKIWLFWPEDHSSKYNWVYKKTVDIQIAGTKGFKYVAFRHCYWNEVNFGNNGDKMSCG